MSITSNASALPRLEDSEKYLYIHPRQWYLIPLSIVSFSGFIFSAFLFYRSSPILYPFYFLLSLTIVQFTVSMLVQGFGTRFDLRQHTELVWQWQLAVRPSVDIFLPIRGEAKEIVQNTWEGVKALRASYLGKLQIYCLDDGNSPEMKMLAEEFGFHYLVREDRGYYGKSGNLRYGFQQSSGDFIAVFDADFRPHPDFLKELLPYFDNPKIGIVQSPQYFDTIPSQNWLERGAGAVQELFYRSIQQSRQRHNGAICVGTNAIYRREALAKNGGTTLIGHSEDVHTGFDVRRLGWDLLYVPILLAKGQCPDGLNSFFRQQYRWCRGSMSLLGSGKFWQTRLQLLTRICYISGFLYYITTAIFVVAAPLAPLVLLIFLPREAEIINYLPLVPSLLYIYLLFPKWHTSKYDASEALSIRLIYGWAHLFAVVDALRRYSAPWHSTGSGKARSRQYDTFRLLILYNLGVGLLWVEEGLYHMATWWFWDFLPVTVSGVIYLIMVSRVVAFAYSKP